MGARGPIAKVTALPGVPQRTDRPTPRRVTLPPGAPVPPVDLCAEAAAEWGRIVAELDGLGLLARIDRAVLATYCDAWAKHEQARVLIDQQGITATGQKGEVVKHPAWMIYTQSATLIAQLAKELFASPNARLRSALPEAPDDDTEGQDILD